MAFRNKTLFYIKRVVGAEVFSTLSLLIVIMQYMAIPLLDPPQDDPEGWGMGPGYGPRGGGTQVLNGYLYYTAK